MRALTLWQPWASCIVHGPKRIENRPWAAWADLIGKRIAIHAGKKWDQQGAEFCAARGFKADRGSTPLGAVIGTARIDRVLRLGELGEQPIDLPRDQVTWFFGPFGWVLEDVRACEPVACAGALGLWSLPIDLVARIGHG